MKSKGIAQLRAIPQGHKFLTPAAGLPTGKLLALYGPPFISFLSSYLWWSESVAFISLTLFLSHLLIQFYIEGDDRKSNKDEMLFAAAQ